MRTKTSLPVLIVIVSLLSLLGAPLAFAQSANVYTSVKVTDITSGAAVVDGIFTTDIQVSITNSGPGSQVGVMGAEIFASYDPTIVGVVGIDPKTGFFDNPYGVAGPENPCSVATGSATATACVHLVLTQQPGAGPVYNRTGTLATIHWIGVQPGLTELSVLADSKLINVDGYDLYITSRVSAIIDVRSAGSIRGYVSRQGYRGAPISAPITVTASLGGGPPIAQATTDASGYFALTVPMWGTYAIQASYPGYLSAQKGNLYVVAAEVWLLNTTLRGGDVNYDNCINIFDLTKVAYRLNSTTGNPLDPVDINDDGAVDIYDLTIAAGNYTRCGPTTW